jgi:hypothetical protein
LEALCANPLHPSITITVNLTFSGLGTASNAAHIHGSAPARQNAGGLFDFTAAATGGTSGAMAEQRFAITCAGGFVPAKVVRVVVR